MAKSRFCVLSIVVALAFIFMLASCRSTKNEGLEEVNPLALLEEDSSIYIYVPVQAHKTLTSDVLAETVQGVSRKDALTVAEHVESLYAGLGTVKDRSRLQIAARGNIPPFAVNALLTKKNGWTKKEYGSRGTDETLALGWPEDFTYYEGTASDFVLSFPSDKVFCASRVIFPLLDRYAVRQEIPETEWTRWVGQKSDEILFYITKPGQYLRSMIGITVNGCDAVYGKMTGDDKENYELTFFVHLTNEKAMRFFASALELSFGMLGGKVEQVDSLTVKMSGVEFTEKKIIDLFTRDPITGKHYRVVNDQIVEEKR